MINISELQYSFYVFTYYHGSDYIPFEKHFIQRTRDSGLLLFFETYNNYRQFDFGISKRLSNCLKPLGISNNGYWFPYY